MSWSIGTLDNKVNITDACAKDLFEAQGGTEIWYEVGDVTYKGKVTFNSDHSEWMDWLGSGDASDDLVAVLKKHKVEGDICFGSLEGDNAGSFWGYRFDGHGGMVELKGKVVWDVHKEPLAGKTVVVTGALESMTREQAHEKIYEAGGEPGSSVTKKTDLLVVGSKPGSKLAKAQRLGTLIINEEQFKELLAG